MRRLPFELAVFFILVITGILAVTLFLSEGHVKMADRVSLASANANAKPKKMVCSLSENRNDGKSCECKEVEE